MATCLKYCVPLAAVCFIGALLIEVQVIPWYSPNDWGEPAGAQREGWVDTTAPIVIAEPVEDEATAQQKSNATQGRVMNVDSSVATVQPTVDDIPAAETPATGGEG